MAGQCFNVIRLAWPNGQGEPIDFISWIPEVTSLLVGGLLSKLVGGTGIGLSQEGRWSFLI